MQNRNYGIGIQSLKELINNGGLYVDKTPIVFKLLSPFRKYYFFSRPRRFGKSLLLSTLKEIFLGNKALFKDTWIYDKIEWDKYAVVHIPFSGIDIQGLGLQKAIDKRLFAIASENEILLETEIYSSRFSELIVKLSQKTGKGVVILIDEYDKPITDYLEEDKIHIAQENRSILRNFYASLKDLDEHIRFCFLTGISKFSKTSLFSHLNHLWDISLVGEFGALVGITQQDIDTNFSEAMADLAKKENMSYEACREEVKTWYNGYNWGGDETVYNPFSVLHLFQELQFANFWFRTAVPSFLLKQLKKDYDYELENIRASDILFESYDIENLDYKSLLFQTGYLTIKSRPRRGSYILGYPNQEVRAALSAHILAAYTEMKATDMSPRMEAMLETLEKGDTQTFEKQLNSLFAQIPDVLFRQNYENFYHAIIYTALVLLGVYTQCEVMHRDGRTDAVIHAGDYIYIAEFKIGTDAEVGLNQIDTKKYAAPFLGNGKKIICLGIAFTQEKKGISDFKVAEKWD